MDTSESKPGSSGASKASAAPQTATADAFKESDIANIVSMGFPREVFILDMYVVVQCPSSFQF